MAEKVFEDMYREFSIGCTLSHPNIVDYKYFVRQSASKNQEQEFHIFIELMDGGNLEEYLQSMPCKREVNI
jgi:serine/threonine protein kinase